MAEQRQKRGSLKLLRQRCERITLEDRDLDQFMKALDFEGVEMLDVFCFGQPGPDVVGGRFRIDRNVYDKLSSRLLELEALRIRKWEVFPEGTPKVDHLLVNLEAIRGF